MTKLKIFGLGFTLLMAAVFLFGDGKNEVPLLGGLFMLFFSPEKIQDERIIQLKTNANMISFATISIFLMLLPSFQSRGIIAFDISTFECLILIMLLSIFIFYSTLLLSSLKLRKETD